MIDLRHVRFWYCDLLCLFAIPRKRAATTPETQLGNATKKKQLENTKNTRKTARKRHENHENTRKTPEKQLENTTKNTRTPPEKQLENTTTSHT